MTKENQVQPGVRVSESLWKQFRQDVQDRRGAVRGHLKTELENALKAYLEASHGGDVNDRLRRIENKLDELSEGGTPSQVESRKKKKDSSVSSRTKNRLDEIEDQINREAQGATNVHESVINAAIEDNAGSSRPTLDRYRQMLKQRHIAFENPNEGTNTWFLDEEKFITVCYHNWQDKYEMITSTYGTEWYHNATDKYIEDEDADGRGFE